MGGVCRDVSDCSYTISDPRLDCTLEGGTNDNRICAITEVEAEPEPPVPAPSQAAARRQRRMLKARMSASLSNVCPERTIGCPLSTGIGHECVNPDEEVSYNAYSTSKIAKLSSWESTCSFRSHSSRIAASAVMIVKNYQGYMS